MAKIIVVGCTGYVGSAIVDELLSRKNEFIAIARDTSKIASSKYMTKVDLDIINEEELTAVLKDADVIVSAFNPGWTDADLYTNYTLGATCLHNSVKQANAKRLIVVGGAGSLYIDKDVQLVDTPDFPEMIKPGAAAVRDYFMNVLQSETAFEWSYLCPAIEMAPHNKGTRTGHFRYGLSKPVFDCDNRSIISVEDLAVAIADEIDNKQFNNRQFTIGY